MQDTPSDPWSATTLDVHRRLSAIRSRGEPAAVATVVDVEGSAYRHPGAKMVLTEDGDQLGGITAGCLEGPLREIASEVIAEGTPILERFDLMDDDEWGLGLGCNGIIDVLVEPVDDSWDPVLESLAGRDTAVRSASNASDDPHSSDTADSTAANPRSVAMVTVVEGTAGIPLGARATVDGSGSVTTSADRDALPPRILESVHDAAVDRATHGGSELREVVGDVGSDHGEGSGDDASVEVFVDGIEPSPKLLVFGGQPDTAPVVSLARQVGFSVTVATARGGLADEDRFPTADKVGSVRPQNLDDLVDEQTAVVVMSHNLIDDRLAIESVLQTDAPYVGLMGPTERFEELKAGLREDGTAVDATAFERVATPVGLDLGGGEPAQIALSIVSEALAVLNGRSGGRLSEREGPIHEE